MTKDNKDMQAIAEDESKTIILRRLPRSLHSAVAKQAIDDNVTQQIVVLRLLKQAGFPVPDELLCRKKRVTP